MNWYTEDMKHFKTTRYALYNRRFVVHRKSLRIVNFHRRAANNGLWLDFVPTRTARLLMKKRHGVISTAWSFSWRGGFTHNV